LIIKFNGTACLGRDSKIPKKIFLSPSPSGERNWGLRVIMLLFIEAVEVWQDV
jgi:hypothetical protein